MGSDGDDPVSLPSPPPPRPAARRAAIDAALRKFDGIEERPARHDRPPRRLAWADMHRRPAGALVAATLIAIIAIPAIKLGLPNRPPEEAAQQDVTSGKTVREEARPAAAEPRPTAPSPIPVAEAPRPVGDDAAGDTAVPQPSVTTAIAARQPPAIAAAPVAQKQSREAQAPLAAAPPPPPPPPPPPAERQAEASAYDEIVVTGSRIERSRLESATPVTLTDAYGDFLSRLQAAFGANDRDAVVDLVGLPLRANFDGEVRTYRSRDDVENDFDRIFTIEVRSAVLNLRADRLASRNGGRLKGNARIGFGCRLRTCPAAGEIRVWEVRP